MAIAFTTPGHVFRQRKASCPKPRTNAKRLLGIAHISMLDRPDEQSACHKPLIDPLLILVASSPIGGMKPTDNPEPRRSNVPRIELKRNLGCINCAAETFSKPKGARSNGPRIGAMRLARDLRQLGFVAARRHRALPFSPNIGVVRYERERAFEAGDGFCVASEAGQRVSEDTPSAPIIRIDGKLVLRLRPRLLVSL